MKKLILLASILVLGSAAMACTSLIVGKKASADGSVMCTYNCDGFGFAGSLFFTPAAHHTEGEPLAIRGWGPVHEGQYVSQVAYTYGVVGLMNEHQLTLVESTFDGRLEMQNPDGLLDYFSLMRLTLQRSTNARQALRCMAELVERYGYNSTGESFTICDPDEAWIMEMVGKGKGRKGAVWVALRVPDSCISAHANLSRIRQFPHEKRGSNRSISSRHLDRVSRPEVECIYAADVVSLARELGYYSGSDADFSFRDAYCPIDFENVRYADARVWSFFNHHRSDMEAYLPYINGHFDSLDHLPLWVKPDRPLTLEALQADMRDHFEGTPLDMTADATAGPWQMPIRPLPMHMRTSDGIDLFRERPIATQQSGFTMTCQMRRWLPNDVGGITWFNCDDANMVAYVPLYCGIDSVPAPFSPENNRPDRFSMRSAFWLNNWVANMIYPRYSMMIADLREAQQGLESYYRADQAAVAAALEPLDDEQRRAYLTSRSLHYADTMMHRWEQLAYHLIVKYNDQVVKRQDSTGHFMRWGYDTPGYSQPFLDAIPAATADRHRRPLPPTRSNRPPRTLGINTTSLAIL